MATTKNKLTFRVTNKNIRLRYRAEKESDRSFTHVKMAKRLGMVNSKGEPQKIMAWKLCQTGKNTKHPNRTYKCPNCHSSQYDIIFKWINEAIMHKYIKEKLNT